RAVLQSIRDPEPRRCVDEPRADAAEDECPKAAPVARAAAHDAGSGADEAAHDAVERRRPLFLPGSGHEAEAACELLEVGLCFTPCLLVALLLLFCALGGWEDVEPALGDRRSALDRQAVGPLGEPQLCTLDGLELGLELGAELLVSLPLVVVGGIGGVQVAEDALDAAPFSLEQARGGLVVHRCGA